ncbi:MAG: TetR/AcrR family transcriptional regulator [Rhodospirillaceae bacterium]
MARPQAPDFDQRRTHIVERAVHLFAERGFLGASVGDLAKACKTSKSLFYHYFPSKEDVLFEAMDSHVRALAHAAGNVAAMNVGAVAKLRALTHSFMHLYLGAAAYHKVLLNELAHLSPQRQKTIVSRQRELIDFVAGMLKEIQPKLEPAQLERAASMIYFGMINWTHTWFHPEGPASADAIADLIADIILNGIKGFKKP